MSVGRMQGLHPFDNANRLTQVTRLFTFDSDLPIELVKGFVYIPTQDQQGFEKIIQQVTVMPGSSLTFDLEGVDLGAEFQVMGVQIVNGKFEILAGIRGYVRELFSLPYKVFVKRCE